MEAPQLSTIPVEAGTSVPPGISAPELPSPSERHVVAPGEHSSSPVVIKRRPGRPKGSGKKQQQTNPPVVEGEKIKRPVGRPRKDGLPAGSVGPRRAARPRKSSLKVSPSAVQLPPGVPFPGVSVSFDPCNALLHSYLTGVLSPASGRVTVADGFANWWCCPAVDLSTTCDDSVCRYHDCAGMLDRSQPQS